MLRCLVAGLSEANSKFVMVNQERIDSLRDVLPVAFSDWLARLLGDIHLQSVAIRRSFCDSVDLTTTIKRF